MILPVRPAIIVHHMAAPHTDFPPNSLEAIRACLLAEADCIEIDIMALADEDYLLVHDSVLESETDGVGTVGLTRSSDTRHLKIKRYNQLTASSVPTLKQIVALFTEFPNRTRLQCDFKNIIPFHSEEPYRRLVDILEPLGDRVIVSTGADWQLRRLRMLAPWLDLGFDIGNRLDYRPFGQLYDPRFPPWKGGAYGYWDDDPIAAIPMWTIPDYLRDRCEVFARGVERLSTFYISHKLLVHSLEQGFNWAEALHGYGIKLDAWTMDSTNSEAVKNAKILFEAGVDQFTSNTPHELRTILTI